MMLRKRLGIDKGSVHPREEIRDLFDITSDRVTPVDHIVLEAWCWHE